MLSFYYLCRTGNNRRRIVCFDWVVVICFHFTIFVVLETTAADEVQDENSCDLLSFYYLCRTGNNRSIGYDKVLPVVICFHFTIFVVLETTRKFCDRYVIRLWFAFILLSLSYWKQRTLAAEALQIVVICFHFTIFVVLETTIIRVPRNESKLWFAFILLSLSYWKQQIFIAKQIRSGCDLLSFYYLCRTGNNSRLRKLCWLWVVICFHFTIFVVLETTIQAKEKRITLLWFAFILLSLSYWKQRILPNSSSVCCCDLLSFYYLCRTGNNSDDVVVLVIVVVICFHFTIFVVLETTIQQK